MSDLMEGLRALEAKQRGYELAEQMYEGTTPECFASARIARLIAQGSKDMRVNFAATPVDAVADRLEITAITGAEKSATARIDEIWDANSLDLEAPEIHRRTGIYGDSYVTVWPGAEGEVEIHYNSPTTTLVVYEAENPRRKRFAIRRWEVAGRRIRANLYYADRIEKWISKEGAKGERDTEFERFVDESTDENGDMRNPFGRVPVFHFRTARPYGRPDHLRAYGPQHAINKLIASQMATVDYQAFPQRYGLSDGTVDTDDTDDLYDDTDLDSTRQQPAQLEAGPGKMWTLEGMSAVGQFDPAEPDNFLKPIEFYIRSMAEVTKTPLAEFDLSADPQSGESRRRKEGPLVKRVDARQLSYGATWREVVEFALAVVGTTTQVQVSWASPATVDDLDGVNVAKGKTEVGVPQDQVLLELGYTPEQLADWGDDIDEGELRRRVALLAELGNAVQRLGAGASLGVIDSATVRATMDKLLGLSSGEDDGENAAA